MNTVITLLVVILFTLGILLFSRYDDSKVIEAIKENTDELRKIKQLLGGGAE